MRKIALILVLSLILLSCEKEDFITSQTGSNIIFISRRTENSADWSLFSMKNDGSDQRKITDLTVKCSKPVVSHSGKTVLFVHYSEDHFYELYSINIDGTGLTLIDRADRYCGLSDWSNDDLKIIYSRNRNESTDDKDLILFDVLTNNKKILTESGNNVSAKFSPDNRIAFCQQQSPLNGIFLINIDGSDKKLIIPEAGDPVWSPDGKKIAYISCGEICSPQIFTANFDGSDPIQLTNSYLRSWDSGFPPFGNHDPQWTPDGKKIVYQSDVNDRSPEIYIMNSDGRNQRRLTNTDKRNTSPEISSDGKLVLFSSNRDTEFGSEIYVMNIDGRNQYPVSKYAGDDCFPVLTGK